MKTWKVSQFAFDNPCLHLEMTLLKDEFETEFEKLREEQKHIRELLVERRAMMEDGHLEAQQIRKWCAHVPDLFLDQN